MKWIWKLVFLFFAIAPSSSTLMWSCGEKSQCAQCEPPECIDCFYEVWSRIKDLMAEMWRVIKIHWFALKSYVEQQWQWLCPCIKFYAHQLWIKFRIFLYKLLCCLEARISEAKCYLEKEIEYVQRKESICKPPERKTNYLNFLWLIPVAILLILFSRLMICSVIDNYGTFFIENIRDNILEPWIPTQTNTAELYERDTENLEMDDTIEETSEESIAMEEADVEIYRKEEQPISMEEATVEMFEKEEQLINVEETAAEIYKTEEQPISMEEAAVEMFEKEEQPTNVEETAAEIYKKEEQPISMEEAAVEMFEKEEQPINVEETAAEIYKKEEQPLSMEETAAEIYKEEEQSLRMEEEEEMEEGEVNPDEIPKDPFFEH